MTCPSHTPQKEEAMLTANNEKASYSSSNIITASIGSTQITFGSSLRQVT
jgi:hypothetical protein